MNKAFFIDTENVGDSWVYLMDENMDSKFYVFYTGHSPRLEYETVKYLLKYPDKANFISCHEGNNGLDFQLVTYLGYQLHEDSSQEMIIVSNDTGFDAVVSFWEEKHMKVKRMNRPVHLDNKKNLDLTDNLNPESVLKPVSDKDEINTIINCIGNYNKQNLNTVFTCLYGKDKGRDIYEFKKSIGFFAPEVFWTRQEKFEKLVDIIFKHKLEIDDGSKSELIAFLRENLKDDKQQFYKNLILKYGNEGANIYNTLKPFYQILYFMMDL